MNIKTLNYGDQMLKCAEVEMGGNLTKCTPDNLPAIGSGVTLDFPCGGSYPYTVVGIERNGRRIALRQNIEADGKIYDPIERGAEEYATWRPSRGYYLMEGTKVSESLHAWLRWGVRNSEYCMD